LNCAYIVDGFCHYWTHDEKPGFFNIVEARFGEELFKQIRREGSPVWVFRAVDFYCKDCPTFKEQT
jgi:hypothetical protein